MKRIARIFEDVGGYYVCPEDGPLDTRGTAYRTKTQARMVAWDSGYTHAVGSGVGSSEPIRLRRHKYADDRYRAQNIAHKGW
jgi:hypothetical protein